MPKLPAATSPFQEREIGRPEALLRRGMQAELDGDRPAAIRLFRQVLKIDPTNLHALNHLGVAVGESGDLAGALLLLGNSSRIDPNQPEVWYNLSVAQSRLGLTREALTSADRMLMLSPGSGDAHFQRAAALGALGRYREAAAAYQTTLRLLPNDPRTAVNHGLALQWCAKYDEAVSEFDRAIALDAGCADAWVSKAMLMMLLGDLPGGLALHEWRWRMPGWLEAPRRPSGDYAEPRWLGETAVAGKTLFLVSDGGLGDALQFCRYATIAAEAGAHVIVGVPHALASLMQTLKGVARVITDGDAVPEYDLNCAMMSLPLAFRTTVETIPASVPYLHAEASATAKWRDRLSGLHGRRIGLVWAGKSRPWDSVLVALDQRRSTTLASMAPLASVPGCHFISLQLGAPGGQAADAPAGMVMHDFTGELVTLADTAALVANLDLVISVDTSTAHLAGALGKPIWLLNRFDTCWRWFLDRDDSPWYPTMRIFRQPEAGDWGTVMRSVTEALRAFADDRAATS
jgi:tetratricopeptide (TPR) repeat protein